MGASEARKKITPYLNNWLKFFDKVKSLTYIIFFVILWHKLLFNFSQFPYNELTGDTFVSFRVGDYSAKWPFLSPKCSFWDKKKKHYLETPASNFGVIMTGERKQIQDEDERVSLPHLPICPWAPSTSFSIGFTFNLPLKFNIAMFHWSWTSQLTQTYNLNQIITYCAIFRAVFPAICITSSGR